MRLWECCLGYWVVVVRAKTEVEAQVLAQAAWDKEQGYKSFDTWGFRDCGKTTAVVGWV